MVHGVVTLSSGREADYYVDLRRITLHRVAAPLVGRVLRDVTADWAYDAVGGLTLGADPVATAIMHAARGRLVDASWCARKRRKHGMQRRIEGPDVAGRRVLVVEDTSTTGGSPLTAVEALREAGAEVVGVAVIVDRGTGAGEVIAAAGLDVPLAAWHVGRPRPATDVVLVVGRVDERGSGPTDVARRRDLGGRRGAAPAALAGRSAAGPRTAAPTATAATSSTATATGAWTRSSPTSTPAGTTSPSRSRTGSTTPTSARSCAPPTPFLAREVIIVGRRRWNRRGAMVTDRYQHVRHHPTDAESVMAWAAAIGAPRSSAIDNLPGAAAHRDRSSCRASACCCSARRRPG